MLARITHEEARAAELLARVIETEGFRRDGYSSATAMLKHRNSIHPNAASQMVARARSLKDAPLVSLAYSRAPSPPHRSMPCSMTARRPMNPSPTGRRASWKWL